jgi:hypothetical protein
MNLNELAREVTRQEGGKVNLSIAQVKEVMRILITELANADLRDVVATLRRYKGKK